MTLFAKLLRIMDLEMTRPTVFGWFHILLLVKGIQTVSSRKVHA